MTTDAAWTASVDAITRNDPHTRGIVVLGLAAEETALADSFAVAAKYDLVKGFAVGRTLFGAAAKAYMQDQITPQDAVRTMADNYRRLCGIWDAARKAAQEGEQP
jgi:5-dehydro-2-deoxygluconokinase